ncbi:cation transport ATPase [Rhodococcus sp. LBL1]|uniref:Cation transport ATPase n=1 Tax=Prescottella agglutinans TaxID=1644129 RepID=A0ABT6MAB5_9NOCA|nr:cation transport ATPase [Prescottella agglutinans]MDH6676520.1 cation transport ATPase [Rhodococcus sp. LBL1]MDH6681806.1 cation transport ATPase [Rhodococcus sp. LBL2]
MAYRCLVTNESNRNDAGAPTQPGKGLFYAAVVSFLIGIVAIVAIFFVHSLSEGDPGLALYILTLACPLGFVLAIAYALRSGRRSR